MKNFWPHRSKAEGFSIEKLARKYREKISIISNDKTSEKVLDDKSLRSMKTDNEELDISNQFTKKGHWANRDFSEYREAA